MDGDDIRIGHLTEAIMALAKSIDSLTIVLSEDTETNQLLRELSVRQETQHNEIMTILKRMEGKEDIMAATIDQIVQDATDESTVEDSLIAITSGLETQLKAILAGALPAAVQAKVDSAFAALEANKAKLAAAVLANTPAAP